MAAEKAAEGTRKQVLAAAGTAAGREDMQVKEAVPAVADGANECTVVAAERAAACVFKCVARVMEARHGVTWDAGEAK